MAWYKVFYTHIKFSALIFFFVFCFWKCGKTRYRGFDYYIHLTKCDYKFKTDFFPTSGWSLTHGSSVHENRGDVIKHEYATSKLPDDINDFPFSKFVQEHFQVQICRLCTQCRIEFKNNRGPP